LLCRFILTAFFHPNQTACPRQLPELKGTAKSTLTNVPLGRLT